MPADLLTPFWRRDRMPRRDRRLRSDDSEGSLFCRDPPGRVCEGDYGKARVTRDDCARMADQRAGIRGRFLLSIKDAAEICGPFPWARGDEVATGYTISSGGQAAAPLLISNRQDAA